MYKFYDLFKNRLKAQGGWQCWAYLPTLEETPKTYEVKSYASSISDFKEQIPSILWSKKCAVILLYFASKSISLNQLP